MNSNADLNINSEQEEPRAADLVALRWELDRLRREAAENKSRRADLTARLKERDHWIQQLQQSALWKLLKPCWKLHRHFLRSAQQIAPDELSELAFGVDDVASWIGETGLLTITGWCFARGGPEVVGVRAKVGRNSYLGRYGLKRADVADSAMDQAGALYSGFSLSLPSTGEAGTVRLEAISQGNPWRWFCDYVPPASQQRRDHVAANGSGGEAPLRNDACSLESPQLYPGMGAEELISTIVAARQNHPAGNRGGSPVFTIITRTRDPVPRWIAEAATSLLRQTFTRWEWRLIYYGPASAKARELLSSVNQVDEAFHTHFLENESIASATNEVLDGAEGEFVCFLEEGDLLNPEALAALFEKLPDNFDLIYCDEDKFDEVTGKLIEPAFKPDWSPEYFRGTMYIEHLLCVRRELACNIRFDSEFDAVQNFDFMLRASEAGARIGHIARNLYHRRKRAGGNGSRSPSRAVTKLQQRCLDLHLERLGLSALSEPDARPHRLQVAPKPRQTFPRISIVIPSRDSPGLLSKCLAGIYQHTAYNNFEVVVVDNDTTDPAALEVMRTHPLTRVFLPSPFNYSRANNLGAEYAAGEYLVFLNNDTEVVAAHWLEELLYYAEQPDVGAAGALLLHENGSVQHGGVVLGMGGTADHAMRGFAASSDGYDGSLSCAREVSAVTAACMMIRKSLFAEVGSFNEHFFTIYQDVDLCLRLRQRGLRIIWTPRALLLHHESLSRPRYYDLVDRHLLLDQWQDTIERGDPYYNRNLDLTRGDYSLARPAC